MYLRSTVLIGLTFLLLVSFAGAEEPDFEHGGGYGGAYNGVFHDGDYLYAAHYEGVTIFDVSDPSDPEGIGFVLTPGAAWDVEVAADHLYIADGDRGIAIANVSDPTSPELVSTLEMDWFGLGVAVRGLVLYVADADSGFVTVDISDPGDPVELDRYDTDGNACDMVIDGDLAYLADGDAGLLVLDVSNPEDIRYEGSLDTAGYSLDADLTGDTLYLADRTNGLLIVDVSVPALPVLQGQYDTDDEAWGVVAEGNYAYVADYGTGLVVVDVSNENLPELEGTMDTSSLAVNLFKVDDEVYIADRTGGMVVADVSDPSSPSEVVVYDTIGMGQDVEVDDDYVYVADDDDLWVLDHSDKYHPEMMSVYVHGNVTSRYGAGLALQGDYIYMSMSNEGLVIVDVSDPSGATFEGQLDTTGVSEGVDVDGDYAYIADGENGLLVIDVSNPSDPTISGSVATGGDVAEDVCIDGDYAYVAAGQDGLYIVDVSTKNLPTVTGSFNTLGHSFDVEVEGDYAYVADGGNGLAIIDVSNKIFPFQVGRHDTEGWSMLGVTVKDDYAYLADNLYGVVILDVTNKSAPTVVDHYDTADATTKVGLHHEYAYVADRYNGLMVGTTWDLVGPPNASIDSIDPDPALLGETVWFNGSADGGSGSYDRYVWESDIDGEIYDGEEEWFSYDSFSAGTHNISLHVRDTEGRWSGNVSEWLRVHERPVAEIVEIDPEVALVEEMVTFTGDGSDDGTIERYVWTSDIDGEIYNGTGSEFDTDSLSQGEHGISLKVHDNDGAWSEDVTSNLTVHERPVCDIDQIEPEVALVGETVTFSANAEDDGSVERYVWTSDIDGELYNGSEESFGSSSLSYGTHDISLVVQDDHGEWSDDDHYPLKIHHRPTATIESISPSPVDQGSEVTFTGSGDDEGSIETYEWTSDLDGELYSGPEPSFTESDISIGTHSIELRVRDADGAWSDPDNGTLQVVLPDNEPPTVTIDSPEQGDTVSGTVTIEGTATDIDGTIELVEISIDLGDWEEADGTISWEFEWDTTDLDDGSHSIRARSYDGEDWSIYHNIGVMVENGDGPVIPDGNGGDSDSDDDEESLMDILMSPMVIGGIILIIFLVGVFPGISSKPAPVEVEPVAVVSGPTCMKCGGSTTHVPEYDRYYCYSCSEYV